MHIENILSWVQVLDINYFIQLNYRWPVPLPHWRHPEFLDDDKSDDDDADAELVKSKFGRMKISHEKEYTYINGIKYMLY